MAESGSEGGGVGGEGGDAVVERGGMSGKGVGCVEDEEGAAVVCVIKMII